MRQHVDVASCRSPANMLSASRAFNRRRHSAIEGRSSGRSAHASCKRGSKCCQRCIAQEPLLCNRTRLEASLLIHLLLSFCNICICMYLYELSQRCWPLLWQWPSVAMCYLYKSENSCNRALQDRHHCMSALPGSQPIKPSGQHAQCLLPGTHCIPHLPMSMKKCNLAGGIYQSWDDAMQTTPLLCIICKQWSTYRYSPYMHSIHLHVGPELGPPQWQK